MLYVSRVHLLKYRNKIDLIIINLIASLLSYYFVNMTKTSNFLPSKLVISSKVAVPGDTGMKRIKLMTKFLIEKYVKLLYLQWIQHVINL